MWYPIDHDSYREVRPEDAEIFDLIKQYRLQDVPVTAPPEDYPELFDELPANFHDDLHTKPEIQRAWRHVRDREHMVGSLDRSDKGPWLRQLD